MNIKTFLYPLPIVIAAILGTAVRAAPAPISSGATYINRGDSLTVDDQYIRGSVVVSNVSKSLEKAGVRQGDVLAMICTKPADQMHYNELAKIAGDKAAVQFVGSGYMHGALPAAKWENGQEIVITREMMYESRKGSESLLPWTNAGKTALVRAGAVIAHICTPVHTSLEASEVVVPVDGRALMKYVFFRDGFPKNPKGSFLIVTMLNWNTVQPSTVK